MSHFSVLVAADDSQDLYEKLIPYYEYGTSQERDDELKRRGLLEFISVEDEYRQEYESDSVDMVKMPDGRLLFKWDDEFRIPGTFGTGSHTHRVPEELEVVDVAHKERYESFEQFIEDWAGCKYDEEHGTWGHYCNPNAKWDWYTVGGRASGILSDGIDGYDPTKDSRNYETCGLCLGTGKRRDVVNMLFGGPPPPFANGGIHPITGQPQEPWDAERINEYLQNTGCNGCKGTGTRLKFNSGWVSYSGDSPLVGMVNWNKIKERRTLRARETWAKYEETYPPLYRLYYRWIGLLFDIVWSVCIKYRGFFVRDWFWNMSKRLLSWLNVNDIEPNLESPDWKFNVKVGQSRRQFVSTGLGALTYAFVDMEGNWHQRGEMGWFGIDDKSKGTKDYDKAFWSFIQSLPPDQRVWVVDCHI